ncbi:MAG TPA: tyrosine-protein phosphatase [Rugosimonospora sp.]|nr:tyrosine-protein phosphatase [Rugosimonospora sp.]
MSEIELSGAPNFRDLGGLAAAGGRRVRPGVLFRAPALGRLTDEDVARLDRLGLVEVIDLRHADEIALAPPDRLPPGPVVTHIPVFDADDEVFRFVAAVMLGQQAPDSPHPADPTQLMIGVYRWLVTSAPARSGFARAVRRIAAAGGRPVLFHCSAGKDRTGWLSALLLSALGVPRDRLTVDYLRTNTDAGEVTEKVVAALEAKRGLVPDAVRPLLIAAPEYLDAAFHAVDDGYGSIDGYLRDGLELDDSILAELRESLLE